MIPRTICRSESPTRMKRKEIMEYYLHESPGRLRVKIPDLKRNPQSAWDLQGPIEEFVRHQVQLDKYCHRQRNNAL